MKGTLVSLIALAFLAAFVGVWGWIAVELWRFEPSDAVPTLDLEAKVVEVAGFLAATVGAGTAAFLGIEIQKRPDAMSFGSWLKEKTLRPGSSSPASWRTSSSARSSPPFG